MGQWFGVYFANWFGVTTEVSESVILRELDRFSGKDEKPKAKRPRRDSDEDEILLLAAAACGLYGESWS